MGNSNIVQSQSESNNDSIQLYYHNKFYGKHKLNHAIADTVQKRYVIASQQENYQFQSLVNTYQKLTHPSILRMITVDMQPLNAHQTIKYVINYEYCPSNLNAEIYLRRQNDYQAAEILEMLQQITDALLLLTKERFPCGVLTPDKIGVVREYHKLRYCITVDLLMNGQQYQNLQILQDESTKKYLSPQQHLGKNASSWQDIHSQTLVYSLGLIALKMIYCEDVPRQKIKIYTFELRDRFSYQFAVLISAMVEYIPANRITLEEIQQEIKIFRNSGIELQGMQRIVKRGYDSVQSTYFFEQSPVSRKLKLKMQKSQQKSIIKQ